MTTRFKRKVKRLIVRTEMWWYAVTGVGFIASVVLLVWAAPTVSNLTIAVIQLLTGFTATVAAAASAIKSDDTEE